MTHKEVHEDAQTSSIGPYHEFLLNVRPNTLHVFVEGPDDPSFYGNAIAPYLKSFDDHEYYTCYGKRQVYKVRTDVLSRVAKPIWWNTMCLLYFVDKDHSDLAEHNIPHADDVYVTDFYSFENFLVTQHMLKRVLQEFIHFYEGRKPRLGQYINGFREILKQFYEVARPIMVWGIFHRKLGKEISFDKVKPGKLFEVRAIEGKTEVVPKYGENDHDYVQLLDQLCEICTSDSFFVERQKMTQDISSLEPKVYTRGKYELWVMLRYIDLTLQTLRRGENVQYKIRYSLSNLGDRDRSKVIAKMLQPLPRTLSTFLEQNFARFHDDS